MQNKKPEEQHAEIRIEGMTPHDLDEVMAIERRVFPVPWTRRFFERELALGFSRSIVARFVQSEPHQEDAGPGPDPLAGYVVSWLVADEMHVLNVAVHPDYRRRGIARQMLQYFIDLAAEECCRILVLEVRRSSLGAQALYKSLGFRQIGVRKGYYSDNNEDAFVMVLQLRQ